MCSVYLLYHVVTASTRSSPPSFPSRDSFIRPLVVERPSLSPHPSWLGPVLLPRTVWRLSAAKQQALPRCRAYAICKQQSEAAFALVRAMYKWAGAVPPWPR